MSELTNTLQVQQAPPVLNLGNNVSVDEYGAFTDAGSFVDSTSGASFTASVDYGDGSGAQALTLNADHSFTLSHVHTLEGAFTVTLSVIDSQTGLGTGTMTVRSSTWLHVSPV